MRNYCTLFDSAYLDRGMVMIESLVHHSEESINVYVLAMDEKCAEVLRSKVSMTTRFSVVSLAEFIAASPHPMGGVKKSRTWQEFCWTCASSFAEFIKGWFVLDEITYLDADLMFFSDPQQIFDEIENRSIGIIPHRFESPKIATNGKFNVSWVTFRGEVGQRCLSRWAEQCREWCFYRTEPGRFGDQKYLDEFEGLYGDAVAVIENPGAGLAPWNLSQYRITDGPLVDGRPVVFYHYHETSFAEDGSVRRFTNYPLRPEDKRLIYAPYAAAHQKAKESIAIPA